VLGLLALSVLMLAALLWAESRAAEPIIPLTMFRHPVIAVCSACALVLGMGMFGVIIYLPLFMQGVLGISATQSGNLLTPLMLGSVLGSIVSGQTLSRTGEYKIIAITGAVAIALGMIVFARMDADTTRLYVAAGMVVSGIGMGLLQPVYTVAVQNVAPRHQMGAATSSTIFFRSIGSTVGVAAFGSIMLTQYHNEFSRAVPSGVPAQALQYFENPLLLVQMRPQIEAQFAGSPRGSALVQQLFDAVKASLTHGLQQIFFWGAVIMCASVVLHLFLRRVPLRTQMAEPTASAAAAVH
jgi:predicted MFS family arabinose efflux permease